MENMRMHELQALARERGLRNYSWLRKAELIAFLQNNENRAQRPPPPPPQMSPSGTNPRGTTWELNRQTTYVHLGTKSTSTEPCSAHFMDVYM